MVLFLIVGAGFSFLIVLRGVKFDKSDIRRLGHEISSNGLFML